jgi:hypothetical protein
MSTEKTAVATDTVGTTDSKRAWTAPELTKMRAGDAETGQGAQGETNSLS